MARNRRIDAELWTDDRIRNLSVGAHLLWIAAMSLADDDGRIRWLARELQIRVFPLKGAVDTSDVQFWMDEIARAGLVFISDRDGSAYALTRMTNCQTIVAPAREVTV